MVLSSKLICSVCVEAYTIEDTVYATSCGHLYHQSCIQSWQSRSKNCAQCKHDNPNAFRVYLELEPDEDHAAKNLELIAKLEENIVAASTMESQLKATQLSLLELQENFCVRESEFQVKLDEKETQYLALLEAKVVKISELESKLKETLDVFFAGQSSAKLVADKMKLEHELERAKRKIDALTIDCKLSKK